MATTSASQNTTAPPPPQKGNALIDVSTCPDCPLDMWRQWFKEAEAAGGDVVPPYGQPIALATSTADGFPSVRMVLLKGVDERGFSLFTNYESRKGCELFENPKAAFVIYWPTMGNSGRQVRVEGFVEKLPGDESDAYFNSRHIISRLGATCSKQSEVIPSREHLEEKVAALEKELQSSSSSPSVTNGNPQDPPRPAYWGGFMIVPTSIEFWCNGFGRLHDRVVYVDGPVDAKKDAPQTLKNACSEVHSGEQREGEGASLSDRKALGSSAWKRVRLSP